MNDDRIWPAIREQRTRLADLLDDLRPDEWDHPSLCAGWTVRDVAAHLTLQQLGPGAAVGMMMRYRGNTPRAIRETSRQRASQRTPAQLVADLRTTIDSRRHTFGVTSRETLIDILVHGEDIAVPLQRSLPIPPDAAVIAINRVFTMHWPPPFPQRRTLSAYRLVATDADWTRGSGPEIRGPIDALLLVATGRLEALSRLSGDGLPAATAQLRT